MALFRLLEPAMPARLHHGRPLPSTTCCDASNRSARIAPSSASAAASAAAAGDIRLARTAVVATPVVRTRAAARREAFLDQAPGHPARWRRSASTQDRRARRDVRMFTPSGSRRVIERTAQQVDLRRASAAYITVDVPIVLATSGCRSPASCDCLTASGKRPAPR
jgi:hypothetical protein